MGCSRCKFQNKSKLELPCLECTQNRAMDYFKPMTNADRIRMMSDEELARYLLNIQIGRNANKVNYKNLLELLQAEVEGE